MTKKQIELQIQMLLCFPPLLLMEKAIENPTVECAGFTCKADDNDSLIVFHIKVHKCVK